MSENAGQSVTISMLNITTNKVIHGSNIRQEGKSSSLNLRIDPLSKLQVVKSPHLLSAHLNYKEEPHVAT